MQFTNPFARDCRATAGVAAHPSRGQIMSLGALAMVAVLAASSAVYARPAPEGFADLAAQVAPAVVTVTTTQQAQPQRSMSNGGTWELPFPPGSPYRDFFERFFGKNGPENRGVPITGVGSGFILNPDGTIVTNNHVVAGAEKIEVTLKDGQTFPAKLIGRDEKTDIAVLKIDAGKPLPSVAFGDSDRVRVGDWVMAVGNPFGLGGTVTAGIVSARGRDLDGGSLIDFLQIDAAINRGNSGGPAFNGAGEVIGINTAIYSPNGGSVGIGFAIPSNLAKQVVAQLREHGKVERGWLGVQIQPVTPELAKGLGLDGTRGALIASVEPNGPAAKAGLKAGDVILGWNGHEISKVRDLPRLVAETPAKKSVEIKLWHKQKAETLRVVTGRMPESQQVAAADGRPNQGAGMEEMPGTGLVVSNLTPALRARFGIDESVTGVVVTDVEGDSAAAQQGLRTGDVIESVQLEPVSSADQAVRRVAQLRSSGRQIVMVKVLRQDVESFFALRLAAA